MSKKQMFRLALLLAAVGAGAIVLLSNKPTNDKVVLFFFFTAMFIPAGYLAIWVFQALHFIAFKGRDGDGLGIVTLFGKILLLPFLPFAWLYRNAQRKRREREWEAGRPERERAEAEARERAYWDSPEGRGLRTQQMLMEMQMNYDKASAELRLAEIQNLINMGIHVSRENEAKIQEMFNELKARRV